VLQIYIFFLTSKLEIRVLHRVPVDFCRFLSEKLTILLLAHGSWGAQNSLTWRQVTSTGALVWIFRYLVIWTEFNSEAFETNNWTAIHVQSIHSIWNIWAAATAWAKWSVFMGKTRITRKSTRTGMMKMNDIFFKNKKNMWRGN